MDEAVRQLFIKAAEVVDSVSAKAVESAEKNVENVTAFVKVANEVSAGLLRAVGEEPSAQAGGMKLSPQQLFEYVYEQEQTKWFKEILLKQKEWLLDNTDLLETLYQQTKRKSSEEWSGKTDTF